MEYFQKGDIIVFSSNMAEDYLIIQILEEKYRYNKAYKYDSIEALVLHQESSPATRSLKSWGMVNKQGTVQKFSKSFIVISFKNKSARNLSEELRQRKINAKNQSK